ncbi:MAG TPA: response regulator [Dermatophilaceae bacterium]|jgi:CheY-like chemotaxis protein
MEWGRSTERDRVPGGEPTDAPTDAPAGARGGARGHGPGGEPGGNSGRVLVCDDTEQIRRLIRVNLELEGYEVVEAVDGQEALEILQDVTQPLPDAITVDVIMPRRDGWWMVAAIRADPRLAHIPIVMVTASAQEQDRAKAERAAVDEFVAKPFDPYELVIKIRALTGGHPSDGV